MFVPSFSLESNRMAEKFWYRLSKYFLFDVLFGCSTFESRFLFGMRASPIGSTASIDKASIKLKISKIGFSHLIQSIFFFLSFGTMSTEQRRNTVDSDSSLKINAIIAVMNDIRAVWKHIQNLRLTFRYIPIKTTQT